MMMLLPSSSFIVHPYLVSTVDSGCDSIECCTLLKRRNYLNMASPSRIGKSAIAVLLMQLLLWGTSAFVSLSSRSLKPPTLLEASLQSHQQLDNEAVDSSRRQIFQTPVVLASTFLLFQDPSPAFANEGTVVEDKAKIVKGYERLTYLLNNWDNLTTKCSGVEKDPFSGKPVCEKTPLIVQDYIGYKSMNDPLFKAEKTMRRLEDLVPAARDADYFDAIEQWSRAVEEASGMAYTSSWAGPQNPNGGDDSIAYYLERSKKQVTDAQGALRTVMDILDLK